MSLEGDDFHSLGAKPAEDFARNPIQANKSNCVVGRNDFRGSNLSRVTWKGVP